ncbi:MAG TPA: tyrosine recombinase [Mobilitalea sp.]|nr:tyrosine recombinase [Mobilitalea sp.]
MEQYINDFIAYMKDIKHASKNTLQAYQNDLRKLQIFLEKQDINSVTKISETNLNSYILTLEKEGLSPASVTRNIAAMKAFILYLMKHQLIQGDPSERIKPPKFQKKTPQVIEISLIDKLIGQPDTNTKKGIRDRAMLELLYATGVKVSEMIAIKVTDLNLSGKYLTCGERRERIVPFGKSAKAALQEYLIIRTQNFDKNNSEYLFLNTNGEQLSRQGLWKILKSYAKETGMEAINPNTIRHSFAAHMIDNGADLGSVQEFLGHSDITTTQLYLTHSYKNSREVYMNTHPRA